MLVFILLLIFIGFAVGLAWFLISNDHGEKEPISMLWVASALGLAGGLFAGFLEGLMLSPANLMPGTPRVTLLVATLAVGIIEEACKFVPLALLIFKKRYFNEHTDGVIYFALAGLGFGLSENILYTLQFGSKAGMVRIFLTPLFHAATTAMVGYFLAKRKIARKSPFGVCIPLAIVMILHGFYDFGLLSGSGVYAAGSLLITLCISSGLFVLFLLANGQDQNKGLSVVGRNTFCRSCGFANFHHHLYCTHCGNNA